MAYQRHSTFHIFIMEHPKMKKKQSQTKISQMKHLINNSFWLTTKNKTNKKTTKLFPMSWTTQEERVGGT